MTHDPVHPFRDLARLLGREKDAASSGEGADRRPSFGTGGGGHDGRAPLAGRCAARKEAVSDEEDAALFLAGVGRLDKQKKRLARRGKSGTAAGRPLAELFPSAAGKAACPAVSPAPGQAVAAPTVAGAPRSSSVPSPALTHISVPAAAVSDADLFLSALAPPGASPVDPAVDPAASDPEEALFAKHMRGVEPLSARGREVSGPSPRQAGPPSVDPAKALRDLLEGKVEFALAHTDEYIEGHVVGLDPLILSRLRQGSFSPEAHLDLHGQNAQQAYDALTWFIRNAWQRGLRNVIIVTGRGRNSPDGVGVLRPLLQNWLCRDPFKRVVLAFCTAKPSDGGPGAVYALLRKYKKSRGKIIWERGHDAFPDF